MKKLTMSHSYVMKDFIILCGLCISIQVHAHMLHVFGTFSVQFSTRMYSYTVYM